ncbi:DUF1851 domain-containing protein [Parvularcula marina]|uniref:DUF1851 domain-containing protein n=1 Tax=Parvularcula marina TaxID=2292771 RepID=A0A371RIL9_9PROT|nr:DUF1851 domain-containing protein [Parvularcula marina]
MEPLEIVARNEFGNLIIRDHDGRYWRLCPEDVYCEVVADSKEHFDSLWRDLDFVADWEMAVLVEAARESLGVLPEDWSYCLVIPGALSGAYEMSNVKSAPLVELIKFSGYLGKQIRDLPDGAQVQLKFTD